jgi:lipoic acid synthetase
MNLLHVIERRSPEEFSRTLEAQHNLLEAKIRDASLPDYLVLVEHQEVYTTGRSEAFQDGLTSSLKTASGEVVPWREIGRGGKATFHGPGQLVAYPIFDLTRHGRDVHVFLRKLEEAGIRCLARFGIEGRPRAGLTGIWVHNAAGEWKKITSLGIGVRKWISYHGLAMNVDTDLRYFQAISPCGQDGEVMTSLAVLRREAGLPVPSMAEVKQAFVEAIRDVFSLTEEERPLPQPLPPRTRPDWLKAKAPGSAQFLETNDVIRKLKLVTVCEEARCPNIGECWSHHTATFMIMGELCTRRCSFCSVRDGTLENLDPLDPLEPYRVGKAIRELGLKHVVITSVNRDDVEDMGAAHFDQTVKAITAQNPDCKIELLIPDMRGKKELVRTILQSGYVSVLNHNVETVPRLYRTVRPGASFQRSLNVLSWAKEMHPSVKTKSGVMVGLGEQRDEVLAVMDSLREAGVEILTVGQYLQPTEKQLPIDRYVTPEEFAVYKEEGLKRGFSYVESAPLVRSSYHAWQHSADPAPEESSNDLGQVPPRQEV